MLIYKLEEDPRSKKDLKELFKKKLMLKCIKCNLLVYKLYENLCLKCYDKEIDIKEKEYSLNDAIEENNYIKELINSLP